MKFLGIDSAVCLSPHPDDVEYAMAGTILKHSGTEWTIQTMSRGTRGDVTSAANRPEEVQAFWEGDAMCVDPPVAHVSDWPHDDWIAHLATDAGVVFLPPAMDTHFEHVEVNRIGRALGRHQGMTVIEYGSPSAFIEWTPNLIVDVGMQFQEKWRRLKTFASQEVNPYFTGSTVDAYHRAGRKGILYSERFRVVEAYR